MNFLMIVIESSSIVNLLLLWHKHILNSLKMKFILQLRTIFGALIILICLICFDRFKSSRKDYLVQGDYFQGGVKKLKIRKSEHFFTFRCRQCHAWLIDWVLQKLSIIIGQLATNIWAVLPAGLWLLSL